jgi:hypothetical protein
MKVAVVFIILLTIYSELTIAMDVTENKNTTVKEHLLRDLCVGTNEPYFMTNDSTYQVYCSVYSVGFTHSFTIRNTAASKISYWSTDGFNCNDLMNGYFYNTPFYTSYSLPYPSNSTSSALITVTGAPCNANPCCFVIYCHDSSDCPLNFDYSWKDPYPVPSPRFTLTPNVNRVENKTFDYIIIKAAIGICAFFFGSIVGCIGYCRYRRTCCFKPKLVSIPSMGDQPMRTSDGTLVVNFK